MHKRAEQMRNVRASAFVTRVYGDPYKRRNSVRIVWSLDNIWVYTDHTETGDICRGATIAAVAKEVML